MIYLASPHSHPDYRVRHLRYLEALWALEDFIRDNVIGVFSPIVHCHNLYYFNSATNSDFDVWKEIDFHFIDRCDEVWVLMMEGWEQSKGVNAEIKYAEEKGMKVKYFMKFLGKWKEV